MQTARDPDELAWRTAESAYLSERATLLSSGSSVTLLDSRYRAREQVRMRYWEKRQHLVAAYEQRCTQLVQQICETGVQSYVSRYSIIRQHRFGIQTLLTSVLSPHTQQADRVIYDVYDVSTRSPIADFIVVIQTNTSRQVSFLAHHIYKSARELNACGRNPRTLSLSGSASDGWMFVDIGEIMVHVFTAEMRRESQMELSELFQNTKVAPSAYPLLTDVVWRSGATVLQHPETLLRPRPRLERAPDGTIRVIEPATVISTTANHNNNNNNRTTSRSDVDENEYKNENHETSQLQETKSRH